MKKRIKSEMPASEHKGAPQSELDRELNRAIDASISDLQATFETILRRHKEKKIQTESHA